jgi:DNA-binding Lrp family transcriptional regulator
MSNIKEKRAKPIVTIREPHKRTRTGIFDNLRQLPHPVEEFLGHVPNEPRVQEIERKESLAESTGPLISIPPIEPSNAAPLDSVNQHKNNETGKNQGIDESPLISERPTNTESPSKFKRPVEKENKALQITRPLFSEGLVESRGALNGQSPSEIAELSFARRPDFSLLNSLPEIAGYELNFHQVSDYLFRQLTTAEQAVYRQLYRLTWGFGRSTVLIGFPKLAERANVGESTARASTKALEVKGLIKRQRMVFGLNHEQGIEWEVYPPPALVKYLKSQANKRQRGSKSERPLKSESPSDFEPMKNSVLLLKEHTQTQSGASVLSRFSLEECRQYAEHLKQTGQGITNPGGYATKIFRSGEADTFIEAFLNTQVPVDLNKCPDCRGSNFVYIDQLNPDRGVRACKHERLII